MTAGKSGISSAMVIAGNNSGNANGEKVTVLSSVFVSCLLIFLFLFCFCLCLSYLLSLQPVKKGSKALPARKLSKQTIKAYIGVKAPDSPCIRVRLDDVTSLEQLRNIVEEEFREEHLFPDEWTLKYRDEDGDLVMITNRTSFEDVINFSVHLELHALTKKIPTNLLGDLLNQSDFLRVDSPVNN